MARTYPIDSRIIFFDVETGGELKRRANRFDPAEFFKHSQDTSLKWLERPEAVFHANNPLLQLHATNIPHFNAPMASRAPMSSFIKPPARDWIVENGERVSLKLSSWAVKHKLALEEATQTEEEALLAFFQGVETNIQNAGGEKVYLGGWNVGYDVGAIERASRRYSGLSKYHGFMGRMYEAGKLDVLQAQDVVLEVALEYGKQNQDFANKYLRTASGKIAADLEDMRKVAGWSLGNVADASSRMGAMGIAEDQLHTAFYDNLLTRASYQDWKDTLSSIQSGKNFDQAFAPLLGKEQSAEAVLQRIYHNPRLEQKLDTAINAGASMGEKGAAIFEEIPFTNVNWKRIGYAGLGLAAAAAAARLAFGKRRDRQTQITGLSDEGIAADSRHTHSAFGSGWRGLQDRDEFQWRKAGAMAGLYGVYRAGMQAYPKFFHGQIRNRLESEGGWDLWKGFGKALSLSHWSGSYIPQDLSFTEKQIVDEGGLTPLGEHFERLFGADANIGARARDNQGLRFSRKSKWSAYMRLDSELAAPDPSRVGFPQGPSAEYEARFAGISKNAKGELYGSRWSGASSRWKRPLADSTWSPEAPHGSGWERWKQTFRNQVRSRRPWDRTYLNKSQNIYYGAEAEDMLFQPLFGRKVGSRWAALKQQAGIVSLEMMERPQRLLSKIGLGVKAGTWNSAFGLGGKLLTRVALPVAAGAFAADYLDYKTDHRLFGSIAGIIPKVRIAHAELTDRIPGARKTTDWYEEHVPGQPYGPLMLPAIGYGLGKGAAEVASWKIFNVDVQAAKAAFNSGNVNELTAVWENVPKLSKAVTKNWGKVGLAVGLAAMAPFVPGMLGSRKTANELRDMYSGAEPVPVHAGRWWELNNTPWKGRRIKAYRANWYARLLTRPERVNTWGSEKEFWAHHPILHPIKWLKDPYALERHNYESRPYPMTSPAGSNIPLIGPIVAATIGRFIKPPMRMHEDEWDGSDYTLFSPRVEPKGPDAIAPSMPTEEFRSVGEVARRQGEIAAELVGLPGWGFKSLLGKLFRNKKFGQDVNFEGSRQMTSWARKYHDQEFGAGMGPLADMSTRDGSLETESYTEPFRRFVQKDIKTLQANEIPNQMPGWLPGADYMIDFRKGDPYTKVPSGSSRLPGPGYEKLHPELAGLGYDQYPTIEKFRILSDVAPWSTQWFQTNSILKRDTENNTEARIEYEKVLKRAEALKASSEDFDKRRYSAPVETLEGTVLKASRNGIELEEMPGRRFQLSALGMTAADLSSVVLGEKNSLTKAQTAREVDERHRRLTERIAGLAGSKVKLVVPAGSGAHAQEAQAVVFAGGKNFNQELLDEGLAVKRADQAGAEFQAMSGMGGKALGKLAESVSFEGDLSFLNPMHWVASGEHSKLWQERTAIEQYKHHEVYGARIQKWEAPIHSFLEPWSRGLIYRATGKAILPADVKERRDLDTLTDQLEYLRSLNSYTNKGSRSAVGADVMGSPSFLRTTLSGRDKYYFDAFLGETSDEKRKDILGTVPQDFGRILQGQWIKRDIELARAEGRSVPEVAEGGRIKTEEEYDAYKSAKSGGETKLNFGDWERSKEIAQFFFRRNIRLPDSPDSPVFDPNIDYEDVKVKIIQEEGLDLHDFNVFDDRAAVLWRKPYIDGAVRELTVGNDRTADQLRRAVETMIMAKSAKGSPNDVRVTAQTSHRDRTDLKVTVEQDPIEDVLHDVRRHPEAYQDQEQ